MTSTVSRRLAVSTVFAIGVHLVIFYLRISAQGRIIKPEPPVMQRVSVSLGCRRPTVPRLPAQKPAAEPAAVQEPEPEPEPEPAAPAPEPEPEPVVRNRPLPRLKRPPVHKVKPARRVKKRQPVTKPVTREVPQQNPSSPSEPETEENQDQSKTAARVIQKAAPLYQVNPPPEYPRLARRRGYEGLVVLEVEVDRYGRPVTVSLSAGSGYSILDKAAVQAVRRWRFQPGAIDGVPQRMTVRVPIRFRLDSR